MTGNYADDQLRIWDVATAQFSQGNPHPRQDIPACDSQSGWNESGRDELRRPGQVDVWSAPMTSRPASNCSRPKACALTYSPDGRWLVARAADEKTVLLLDARTHEMAAQFRGHERFVFWAAFSPDSLHLATCSKDRTVRVWEIDSGLCQVLRGHTDEVFAAAFHPNGTRLATAGRDRAVWLWDLARGEEVARLPGHTSYVWSLAFSPDGTTLASGSGDFTVHLWDTEPLKTRYQARRDAAALQPEAERRVDELWRQKNDPAAVVEALRADRALSEPLRHAALRRAAESDADQSRPARTG